MRRARHKFGAKPTRVGGRRYDSKLEASYAKFLTEQKLAGDVLFWLEQVPIRIPGGTYKVDFQIFMSGGEVRFVDVKGFETPMFKLKKKAVEELYPFEIEIITRKNIPRRHVA